MARFRKNWNGLTEITVDPEPVFIPKDMTLKVFPVAKKVRIETVAVRKRSYRDLILKAVTVAAAVVFFGAVCTLHRPTVAGLVVAVVSLAWMALFAVANRR